MGLFVFSPRFYLPSGIADGTGAIIASASMNAATHKRAHLFTVSKSGTLDKYEFRTGSSISLNSASQIRISFQDVSTSSVFQPDGTQDQYRDIAGSAISASAWIAPGLMTSDGTDTGTKRTVTAGDLLAVVFEFSTFHTSDVMQVANTVNGIGNAIWPGSAIYGGSSWTVDAIAFGVLKYSDGSYVYPWSPWYLPASAANEFAFSSSTSPGDERGLLFQVPLPYQVNGLYYRGKPSNASADYQLVLYDSSNTVVASVTQDATIANTSVRSAYHVLTSPVTLTPNSDYRLILKPTTTNNLGLVTDDFASAAIKNAIADPTWKYTYRTDGGAWTDLDTRLPLTMGIEISGIVL